jgi:hypothetical protein
MNHEQKGASAKFGHNLKEQSDADQRGKLPPQNDKSSGSGQAAVGAKRSDGANKGGGAKGSSGGRSGGSD